MPSSPPPIWLLRFGHWFQSRPPLAAALGVAVIAMCASGLLTQLIVAPFAVAPAAADPTVSAASAGDPVGVFGPIVAAMLACGAVAGALGALTHRLLRDLTAARSELLAMTTHDATTQALSAGYFLRRAQQTIDRAGPQVKDLCVVLIRVERFDALLIEHGRVFIDEVLRAIGGACLRQLRAHDLFARHGDDEFVGLLQASHPNLADIALGRLRRAVEVLQHVDGRGVTVPITVSFGVSQIDYDTGSLEKALARITQRREAPRAENAGDADQPAGALSVVDATFRSGKAPA